MQREDFSIVILIDTLMVFLKKNFERKRCADNKKHPELPNMQRLRLRVVSSILNVRLSARAQFCREMFVVILQIAPQFFLCFHKPILQYY